MQNLKDNDSKPDKELKLASLSKWLGIAGLVSVPLAFAIGFLFEQVGIVSILRSLSIPLCLAAAVTGLIVLNRGGDNWEAALQKGRLGLILGLAGIGVALLIMALVMLLFLPLLFLSADLLLNESGDK